MRLSKRPTFIIRIALSINASPAITFAAGPDVWRQQSVTLPLFGIIRRPTFPLPATFTHALSLRQLPPLSYYGYILLRDFFFMLDDLIIFTLAAVALQTTIGSGYAKYDKLVGGPVLILLGLTMLLAPELLR